MASETVILPQGAGYGVVVGIGFFFALLMAGITWLQNRYTDYSTRGSEEFNTASRSVKAGMVASAVVSAWTWAATLLQSSTVTYEYGISGPFWLLLDVKVSTDMDLDAAGATVQIFMFSVIACKVKQNAPRCHTFLEIVYARYGPATHIVFICFALTTNILVASQLLLGGSAVVTSLTGMNVYAAVWLIPMGVAVYVVLGGLRATFFCDYSHTVIVMIIILYFMFNTYATNDLIGSPTAMYNLIKKAGEERPVAGNYEGSYLTMKSNLGLVFAVIQLCSGMGTVFLDQGYWQRAIASRPSTAVKAYILGGLAWFAIPFGFATTLGLAAVALTDHPSFPTYPNKMTDAQVSSGLSACFGAQTLLGTHGAIALLITLFMAVTSSSSAQLIAVSSILTFDIFKTYIKPTATPKQLIMVAHVMICVFAVVMALFASIWNIIGISLGWLFVVMGLIIGGAVFPAAFTVTWKGQTRLAAIVAPPSGLAAGLTAWLVEAEVYYGTLNVTTTGSPYPTLAGNMAAVLTGLIVSIVVSLVFPDKKTFNWETTRNINVHIPMGAAVRMPASEGEGEVEGEKCDDDNRNTVARPDTETADGSVSAEAPTPNESAEEGDKSSYPQLQSLRNPEALEDEKFLENPKALRRHYWIALVLSIVLSFIMDFLVPIPMFLSHYIFSHDFFYAWVVISFIWVFAAMGISGLLPLWETRHFWKGFFREIARREHKEQKA
ncbi:urea-proton symporter [Geosmithia morbida]|uniref:Urea-proton symporter n=1 Tax=Geosmithia morbida TaxID=1094350 RepID=A0A9P4YW95_9HYPO|nr:urea-proton symporter [Geosmithia morbida]KAF4122876.1 urea-proton symporter [Geosmithia morbida]